MAEYFDAPFPFHEIIKKTGKLPKLSLEESIRSHIRSLILMRSGEFIYNRETGFDIWDYDKEVFYHTQVPYYEKSTSRKRGALETNATAKKYFKQDLKRLIEENELRLDVSSVEFEFEKVHGNMSVYQRMIAVKVHGKIRSTGKSLSPPFKMNILYTPFIIETN